MQTILLKDKLLSDNYYHNMYTLTALGPVDMLLLLLLLLLIIITRSNAINSVTTKVISNQSCKKFKDDSVLCSHHFFW